MGRARCSRGGCALARTLLRLGKQVGVEEADGSLLIERITQQEVADIAGASLFTVSRTLADWQDLGIVATGRQRYRIRDAGRLGAMAEGRRPAVPVAYDGLP